MSLSSQILFFFRTLKDSNSEFLWIIAGPSSTAAECSQYMLSRQGWEKSGGTQYKIKSPHLAATWRWLSSLVLLTWVAFSFGDRPLFYVFSLLTFPSTLVSSYVFSIWSPWAALAAAEWIGHRSWIFCAFRSSHGSSISYWACGVEGLREDWVKS